jgi:acetolactate synthase small subunit
VQNEPGVLSRVSGILAARGFNIDSLVVCNTEVDDLSRMTIVLQGQDGVVEQARRQLEDLVPVWAVLDYTTSPLVQRELLLAKISTLGPEYFEELLAHHREMASMPAEEAELSDAERDAQAEEAARESLRKDFHPNNLAVSQALRHKHEHLRAITFLTHQFGGKVLDISTNNCIVEVSAKSTRIDSFMKLIAPFGILESARTGEQLSVPKPQLMCANHSMKVLWLSRVPHCTRLARPTSRMLRTLWTRLRCLRVKLRNALLHAVFGFYYQSVLGRHSFQIMYIPTGASRVINCLALPIKLIRVHWFLSTICFPAPPIVDLDCQPQG